MNLEYSGVENLDLRNEQDFEIFRFLCQKLPLLYRQQLKQTTLVFGIFSEELISQAHFLIIEQNKRFNIGNLDLQNDMDLEYFRLVCRILCEVDKQKLIQTTKKYGILSDELKSHAQLLIIMHNQKLV